MNPTQVARYARVSSEQPAETHTIASQVAALRERVATDGLTVSAAMQFLDEGSSGATWVRPALERLRDVVAAGSVDRLYVHSPDRLARKYAYQVLLVDEFRRAGVEVMCLHRALGQSPEDDLRLQGQGMMAEYERAQIIERQRRGKRHAARVGTVNVLSGAPYGYRDVTTYEGGGQARYEIISDEARVVRQVFDWVGRDRRTMGEVCRRLTQAGEVTRTGKTVWDRSVVGGILKNPAYQGAAAVGKTRQEPLRPRLRTQRSRPVQPRRAVSTSDVPPEAWITIPVPALVAPEVFATVQEQWRENKRQARQSRRGALYLLQGLLQCQHCGDAFSGKRLSPSARQGKPRAYAYDRGLGTDAYRFGGERLCQHTQVRTDLLDLAVWQEVCTWLAHPERLAEEYRRRLQPETHTQRPPLATLEGQISQLRQGVARLIDSDADHLIDKHEFEPRITRLRQRLARLEEQRQARADEAALHGELPLIIGRLEDFAAKLHDGLAAADGASQRDLIRALVKRVEVARDDVNIVFRIDPYPGDVDPEKKVCNFVGGELSPLLTNLLLDRLDKELEKRGHTFVRYADDCNIYVKSKRAGERVLASVTRFLSRKLKRKVNAHKSAVDRPWRRKFLGVTFTHSGPHRRKVSGKARERFKEVIRGRTQRTRGKTIRQVVAELGNYINGWKAYFGLAQVKSVFKELDSWIRRRLRCYLWKQWGRRGYRELLRRGISRELAWNTAKSAHGPWRLSKSPGLSIALPGRFFDALGLPRLFETKSQLT